MSKPILIFIAGGAVFNAVLAVVNIVIGRFDLVPINLAAAAVCIVCLSSMSR